MKVQICNGKLCRQKFSEYIFKRISQDIEKFKLHSVILEKCSCLGDCEKGPNVLIDGKIENYQDPAKTSKIILDKVSFKKLN